MIDVALVGGGPAGLALAGMLAVRGRRVVVFERTTYAETRVGETFGAEIGARLDDIGAAQAMADLLGAQLPFALVRSTWGSDEPAERPSIMHPLGTGWHVERARFDERLAEWAASVGADVRRSAGKCSLVRSDDGVSVRSANGDVIATRLAVDASGRGALASTGIGARHWCAADRQVAIMTRMTVPAGHTLGPELLLEAVDIGFWYSAPLPDGTLVIVLVTDADLLVALGRDRRERLVRALAASTHTRVRADGFALAERPRVVRSDSGWLVPDRGVGWRAIGDAAMATDPLRGHGVARALRSAFVTASELDDPDVTGDPAEARHARPRREKPLERGRGRRRADLDDEVGLRLPRGGGGRACAELTALRADAVFLVVVRVRT